jgi:hypothetical protein
VKVQAQNPVFEQAMEKVIGTFPLSALGLKPRTIFNELRGPEGPLFHGYAHFFEFPPPVKAHSKQYISVPALTGPVKRCPDTNLTFTTGR